MKEINLTQDQVALVDDEDWEELSKYKWYARWDKKLKSFYAIRNIRLNGKKTSLMIHRQIMKLCKGDKRQVDHVNHNTLDNRKCNLRIVTNRQNLWNRKNQSKFGQCIELQTDKYRTRPFRVQVQLSGKRINIGSYETRFDAIIARDEWLKKNVS